jgi:hypothetical protein
MISLINIFLIGLFYNSNEFIFPNKNVSIDWDDGMNYDINLSILDTNWNILYNNKIISNQESPFQWEVPNLINNYTYFNKNLLFIYNNNVVNTRNINNYGAVINQNDNYNYEVKSNYDCEYYNLSFGTFSNFLVHEKVFELNNSYFGIYDVTITSNDHNLLIYQVLNISKYDETYSLTFSQIVLIVIISICALATAFGVIIFIMALIEKITGIKIFKFLNYCKCLEKKKRNSIYPQGLNNYNKRVISPHNNYAQNTYQPNKTKFTEYKNRSHSPNYLEESSSNFRRRHSSVENNNYYGQNYNRPISNYDLHNLDEYSPTDSVNSVFI